MYEQLGNGRMAVALATGAMTVIGTASTAHGQCVEGCTAIHVFTGEATGDQFGWVSNDVGDIDGDTVHDLVLTAPTNTSGAGRIYVYSGLTGGELWRATGSGGWTLGHDAACAGDVDGSGVPDIIAGAPGNGAGRAIVYAGDSFLVGQVLHTFVGESIGDQFGFRVYGGGDFNGDGSPDLIVGAPFHDAVASNAGRAYIYSGDDWSLICTIDGPTSNDRFGSGVAFVGDISNPPDGRDDVAVGAMGAGSGGGLAWVYEWDGARCQQSYVLNPGSPAANFGQWFMNGGHDVDGDGVPDIYVNDFGVNRAHIFSGADGEKIWTLTGESTGGFGIGRLVPDINGDGRADALLAAWSFDGAVSNGGKAYVYSGRDASVMEQFTHTVSGATFGFDANGMGDVDGDGRFDHLVTAAWDSGMRGKAYLIAGTIAPTDFNGDGVRDVEDLVILVLAWGDCTETPCIGDTNGDGTVDVSDLVNLILSWG